MSWVFSIGIITGVFLYFADLFSTNLSHRIAFGEIVKKDERVQKVLNKGQFCLGGDDGLILYPNNNKNFFVSWKKPTWFKRNGYYIIFNTESIDSSQNLLKNLYNCIKAPDGRISPNSNLHQRLKRLHSNLRRYSS